MESTQVYFDVYLDGEIIWTAAYGGTVSDAQVKRDLINSDGFDPRIFIVRVPE